MTVCCAASAVLSELVLNVSYDDAFRLEGTEQGGDCYDIIESDPRKATDY